MLYAPTQLQEGSDLLEPRRLYAASNHASLGHTHIDVGLLQNHDIERVDRVDRLELEREKQKREKQKKGERGAVSFFLQKTKNTRKQTKDTMLR